MNLFQENTDIFLKSLQRNKIKTWMLTGDYYTRALASAYQSKIVRPEESSLPNSIINIKFDSSDYDDIKFVIRHSLERL